MATRPGYMFDLVSKRISTIPASVPTNPGFGATCCVLDTFSTPGTFLARSGETNADWKALPGSSTRPDNSVLSNYVVASGAVYNTISEYCYTELGVEYCNYGYPGDVVNQGRCYTNPDFTVSFSFEYKSSDGPYGNFYVNGDPLQGSYSNEPGVRVLLLDIDGVDVVYTFRAKLFVDIQYIQDGVGGDYIHLLRFVSQINTSYPNPAIPTSQTAQAFLPIPELDRTYDVQIFFTDQGRAVEVKVDGVTYITTTVPFFLRHFYTVFGFIPPLNAFEFGGQTGNTARLHTISVCSDGPYKAVASSSASSSAAAAAAAPAQPILFEDFSFTGALAGRTSTGATSAWVRSSSDSTFWDLVGDASTGGWIKGATYAENDGEHLTTVSATPFSSLEISADIIVPPDVSSTVFPEGAEVVNLDVHDTSDRFNRYVSLGAFLQTDEGVTTFRARAEVYFYESPSSEIYDFASTVVSPGTVSVKAVFSPTNISFYANNTLFLSVDTTLHASVNASGVAIYRNLIDNVPGAVERTSLVRIDNISVVAT